MLVRRTGAGSDRAKSMFLVLLAFKSSWRPRKECCMALNLVWRFVNTVSKEEVDQRITHSKSDIIDLFREKNRPEN
jgi:hypothetical protein